MAGGHVDTNDLVDHIVSHGEGQMDTVPGEAGGDCLSFEEGVLCEGFVYGYEDPTRCSNAGSVARKVRRGGDEKRAYEEKTVLVFRSCAC